jgi:hypothetical protein
LSGALADVASLRRIERGAAAWMLAGALAYAAFGRFSSALVLTVVSAAGIVAFRGLQGIVSAIGPAEQGDREAKVGWRQGLKAFVRLGLWGALLAACGLLLDRRLFPAIVLGCSTLPAALMTEGLLQAVRAFRGRDHDDVS